MKLEEKKRNEIKSKDVKDSARIEPLSAIFLKFAKNCLFSSINNAKTSIEDNATNRIKKSWAEEINDFTSRMCAISFVESVCGSSSLS